MRSTACLLLLVACAQHRDVIDLSAQAGHWESVPGLGYDAVTVHANGDVEWVSIGSEGRESGRSRAVFRDGKLILTPPMRFYQGPEVGVLQYERRGGREYLMTDLDRELMREDEDPVDDYYYGMQRRLSQRAMEPLILAAQSEKLCDMLFEEWWRSPVDLDSVRSLERIAMKGANSPAGEMACAFLSAMITNDCSQEIPENLQQEAGEALDRVILASDEE